MIHNETVDQNSDGNSRSVGKGAQNFGASYPSLGFDNLEAANIATRLQSLRLRLLEKRLDPRSVSNCF
jgi:hypothetical protein